MKKGGQAHMFDFIAEEIQKVIDSGFSRASQWANTKFDSISSHLFGNQHNPVNNFKNYKKHFSPEELGRHHLVLSTKPLVIIPEKFLYEHMLDMGASGKGKTVLLRLMFSQHIASGAGVIVFDPKDDLGHFMLQCATQAGRIPHFHSFRLRGQNSETWNPIYGKNPIEIANRLHVALFADDPEANSFYKNVAASMLRNLFSLLMGYGKPLTLKDIYYAVVFPQILERVVEDFKGHPELYRQALEVDQDFIQCKNDDAKKLTKGLRDKLQTFIDSPWSPLINTYNPDIVIEDIINKGEILHLGIASDVLGRECYQPIMRMLLADFKQAAGHRFSQEEKKPCFLYCDEFGDVASEDFMEAIKKYRSAGIGILIGFQSLGDLERRGEPFKKDVIQNCATKIFFNLPEPQSADYVAKLIGTFADTAVSAQSFDSEGNIKGKTEKLDMRTFKITPDILKNLNRGNCIAVMPFHSGREYPVFSFKTIYIDSKAYPAPNYELYSAYRFNFPKDESIGLNLENWVKALYVTPPSQPKTELAPAMDDNKQDESNQPKPPGRSKKRNVVLIKKEEPFDYEKLLETEKECLSNENAQQ
jgi:hypothetical protein